MRWAWVWFRCKVHRSLSIHLFNHFGYWMFVFYWGIISNPYFVYLTKFYCLCISVVIFLFTYVCSSDNSCLFNQCLSFRLVLTYPTVLRLFSYNDFSVGRGVFLINLLISTVAFILIYEKTFKSNSLLLTVVSQFVVLLSIYRIFYPVTLFLTSFMSSFQYSHFNGEGFNNTNNYFNFCTCTNINDFWSG